MVQGLIRGVSSLNVLFLSNRKNTCGVGGRPRSGISRRNFVITNKMITLVNNNVEMKEKGERQM